MPKTALRMDADFEAFYDRHWKYVYRLCLTYLRNSADAEDCTEDVFVKVLVGDFAFEDETHERKWITLASINLCKDKLKSYTHKKVVSLEDDGMPELAATEPEDYSDVLAAVIELPQKLKDVVWLYYYVGYTTNEIARFLRRPASTVRNQLKDARNRLKTVLGGDFR